MVRQKLGWFPYKPRNTIPLTPAHKQGRVNFCNWLLSKPEAFCDQVIWSDEKWFVLRQPPNRQNERYWAPSDPEVEVPCKEQGGKKVMAWVGVVAGRVILHWFPSNVSVNGERYLQMLQQVLEPLLTRDDLWFQQDGAPPHMPARAWLQEVFQDRVISRLTTIPWPARSPDLSCLDFWFWGVAMEEVRRSRPTTLNDLKAVVEAFAESVDMEEVELSVRSTRKRALACRAVEGASFEGSLKKILKGLEA